MSYKEYKVQVFDSGAVYWHNEEDDFHREDGPAVTNSDGKKEFYLNDIEYTEEEYWEKVKPAEEMTIAQIEKELGRKIKVVK